MIARNAAEAVATGKLYAALGGAVQEQLDALLAGGDLEDCNINALFLIRTYLDKTVAAEDRLRNRVARYCREHDEALKALKEEKR